MSLGSPLSKSLRPYLRSKARILCVGLLLGVIFALGPSTPNGDETLEAYLGRLTDSRVEKVVHGAHVPAFVEWLSGRSVYFSATTKDGASDVYRARVRRLGASLLGATRPERLTKTAASREEGLCGGGGLIAFTHVGERGIEAVSFLAETSAFDAFVRQGFARSLLRESATGVPSDLDWVDVILTRPAERLLVEERGKDAKKSRKFAIESESLRDVLEERELFRGSPQKRDGLLVIRRGDTRESLPTLASAVLHDEFGAGFATLEETFLSTKNFLGAFGKRGTRSAPKHSEPPDLSTFPPPRLENLEAAPAGVFRPLLGKAPDSPLQETTIFVSPERPDASFRIVLIDTSRLELGLRAGYSAPLPSSGPRGSGVVSGEILPRLVATMNGGSPRQNLGLRAEGKLFRGLSEGAPTVRLERDGRIRFSDFHADAETRSDEDSRQGLPLFAKTEPSRAALEPRIVTERSGLGVTKNGMLVYAWSAEANASELAKAFETAGAIYAMSLASGPGNTLFARHEVKTVDPLVVTSTPLAAEMRGDPSRHLFGSANDFFFLAERSALPERSSLSFTANEAEPLLVRGRRSVADVEITALRFAIDVFRPRFVRGRGDSKIPGGTTDTAPYADAFGFAFSAGHATRGSRPGLLLDAEPLIPQKSDFGTLVIARDEPARIVAGREETSTKGSLVQFPLLLADGRPTEEARRIGETRTRAALCFEGGFGLWVSARTDSPVVLAQTLLEEGCQVALLLDRGSHEEATLVEAHAGVTLPNSEASFLAFEKTKAVGRAYAKSPP